MKRPKTAYFIFMLERKGDSDLKHKGGPELTRIIGEEWGKLTEYEKEVCITISFESASPESDHLYRHTRRSRPKTAHDTSGSIWKCTASLPLHCVARKTWIPTSNGGLASFLGGP